MHSHILIVEDNEVHRSLVKELLMWRGYSVTDLDSGRNFFSTVAAHPPQLILMDLKMPEPDGFKLLHELRRSCWRAIPVIVISAFATPREQHTAEQLGIDWYCVKPLNFDALSARIEATIKHSSISNSGFDRPTKYLSHSPKSNHSATNTVQLDETFVLN